jgi:hypothetical protein
VPAHLSSKSLAQCLPEIVFAWFGFHYDFVCVSKISVPATHDHEAVVGFTGASFEGGIKSGDFYRSLAATCGARFLKPSRSLTFCTVAVRASICFCCCATVLSNS